MDYCYGCHDAATYHCPNKKDCDPELNASVCKQCGMDDDFKCRACGMKLLEDDEF